MAKKLVKHPNDDLFESTTMSFGEHLEELRMGLFRAMIGLVVGFLVGLIFAKDVVTFIQAPLKNSLDKYYLSKATKKLEAQYEGKAPIELLETIRTRHLVPSAMQIEPYGLVESLRANYPDVFGDIRLPRYQFTAADFVDSDSEESFVALAQELKASRSGAAQAVWRAMSAAQREAVSSVAKAAPDKLTDSQRRRIVKVFNELLNEGDLRRLAALTDASGLSGEAAETIEQIASSGDLGEDQTRRLNKLLLSGALAEYIRPPQVAVIDVPTWKPTEVQVQALGAHEAFMIWMKAGLVTGIIFASPWIFWQLWVFVAAGLYPHEKRYVHIYLPFSLLLFLSGAALAFFVAFEPVLDFLFTFNERMEIDPDPRISEWLSFVLFLPLGFGISFQLPLVMLFINRIGIVPLETYVQKWRVAILAIFVISMILTPADPISMLLMAGPLTVLYFLGILLCRWMPRNRNPFGAAYEPA